MDPRILKIARIILIPVFFYLIYSAYGNVRDISVTAAGQKIFERSMKERWPDAFAKLNKPFMLWHREPYKKGDPMNIELDYSYRVANTECHSNRFEFGPRKTAYTEIPVGDARLNYLIKRFCPGKPEKTTQGDKSFYQYSCYPIQVFYDPQNICLSYVVPPSHPDTVRYALKKNIGIFILTAMFKIILAGGCVYGALPLLKDFKRKSAK